jgi:hypothetical protein
VFRILNTPNQFGNALVASSSFDYSENCKMYVNDFSLYCADIVSDILNGRYGP